MNGVQLQVSNDSPDIAVQGEQAFLDDQAHDMRAGVYELLARLLYRSPDQATLAVLAGLEPVDTGEGQVALGWELLRQAAVRANPADVEDEYFNLFIGVGRGELVPFGSWYLTGFLMEKPLAVLRQDLERLGFERQAGIAESEDHIAALCDVMAMLIREEGGRLQLQRTFFNDHIAPWAARFFDDLQNAQHARFYRSVGFFGDSVLRFEQQLLEMKV